MLNQLSRTVGFILDHPIGRRHPLRCLGRFAGWQLRSRLSKGPHRIDYIGDTHFLARRGETGLSGNIYVGLHEFADMAFVAHALRPGDLFVDAGANAGSYTLLAAGWSGAQVIAIEPVPDTFARLEANVRSNDLSGQVELHRVALGAGEGTIAFTDDNDTTNHAVPDPLATARPTIEVPLRTLDAILADRTPSIIKLDVEGFEREVLAGASRTLTQPELAAILVEIFTDRQAEVGTSSFEMLRGAGFQPCRYDPWQRKLIADSDPPSGNVLFVREPERLAARLHDANAISIMGDVI